MAQNAVGYFIHPQHIRKHTHVTLTRHSKAVKVFNDVLVMKYLRPKEDNC